MVTNLKTDVLIVGGGTGGTSAAIQASRRGVKTTLVSEFSWLGGMLTAAGVCAPDGNELAAWQTGLWGSFLQALQRKQTGGLDNSWVSLFTYDPRIGAEIFAEWVKQLPNLHWISGQVPLEVKRQGNRITEVRFADYLIEAKIAIDGTELGDLIALAEVPYRWGWELQREFNEPSAPVTFNELTQRYPVQSPTWVFILQDYQKTPPLPLSPTPLLPYSPSLFQGAWANYGADKFLNYGRLPGDLFMINWPICGNDYGERLGRLIETESSRREFLEEACCHSQNFAYFIQKELGQRYGLAENIFPHDKSAFALHPYYRESRRIIGQVTVTEKDILPIKDGCVAALPMTEDGEVSAIAIGNYANDHHYPGIEFPLQPKSIRWGGRWTGTPFTIPYGALVPNSIEGLLVCEKNISVSHIANGSTRLQPVVMNIGQAAGMAAALCIELNCQPHEVPIRHIQEALLTDSVAPAAAIPLYNLVPEHCDRIDWQRYYLDCPEEYPLDGNCPGQGMVSESQNCNFYQGIFRSRNYQQYSITLTKPASQGKKVWSLITTRPEINLQLQDCQDGQLISLWGRCNFSGGWLLALHGFKIHEF
ncbi:MAG: FAD-dependent oxidoreductase [Hydrococcus sp. CRU_1_1]|nr:FAD-dependent oxidoreductase [Hydrococcus sp. CRU_1_1]